MQVVNMGTKEKNLRELNPRLFNYIEIESQQGITAQNNDEIITFVVISDTHNMHDLLPKLPHVDVLIHTGDFTNYGMAHEALSFNRWLGTQTHIPYRVVIPGNHENWADFVKPFLTNCTHFLMDECVTVKGVKIYGSRFKPFWSKPFMNDSHAKTTFDEIPLDADIVLTHQPAKDIAERGSMTRSRGNVALRDRVLQVKPLICISGHVHGCYGHHVTDGTTFINAALVIGAKSDRKLERPIVFHLIKQKSK